MKNIFLFLLVLIITSCGKNGAELRLDAVASARTNGMSEKIYDTSIFKIFSLQKINDNDSPLHIYIEGDGRAWISRNTLSGDPTPRNSVALQFALKDDSSNIIYLARPCQFIIDNDVNCESKYWSTARFSKEVIDSYVEILRQYNNRKIDLIGHSGGGAVIVLAAAKLDNISSITTIAGNLDHEAFTTTHDITPLSDSENMDNAIKAISHIPQKHYMGGEDKIITKEVFESFRKKLLPDNKASFILVPGATHNKGWDSIGNQLVSDQ